MTVGPYSFRRFEVKAITFDEKKLLISLFPYLFVGYLADKVFWLYRHQEGEAAFWKAAAALQRLGAAFANPLPSFWPIDLFAGMVGALLFAAGKYIHDLDKKKLRHGVEYGSARWGTAKDIAPFVDPDPEQNIILTRTEGLTMKPYGSEPKYSRNKNVLVIGGSGSGKTRFFVKPNLMQMHSSYVVTDPKGMETPMEHWAGTDTGLLGWKDGIHQSNLLQKGTFTLRIDIRNEIKSIIVREGLTMEEVVNRLSELHGWSRSVPNFSGKLLRGSLRYTEALELADALGYDLIWKKRRV